jgi:hypothetical protein
MRRNVANSTKHGEMAELNCMYSNNNNDVVFETLHEKDKLVKELLI